MTHRETDVINQMSGTPDASHHFIDGCRTGTRREVDDRVRRDSYARKWRTARAEILDPHAVEAENALVELNRTDWVIHPNNDMIQSCFHYSLSDSGSPAGAPQSMRFVGLAESPRESKEQGPQEAGQASHPTV